MKYWSFNNRDPDNGLHTLQSPHDWVVFHPLYTAKKSGGPFFSWVTWYQGILHVHGFCLHW